MSIAAVHVTQVVPDFSIAQNGTLDLVSGKEAYIQAFLTGKNISPSDSRSINVQLQAPANPSPVITSVPLINIASASADGYEVDSTPCLIQLALPMYP